MYSHPTRTEIAIVENLSFLQQGYRKKTGIHNHDAPYATHVPRIDIGRNLYDDTFNMIPYSEGTRSASQFISIDNKTDFVAVNDYYRSVAETMPVTITTLGDPINLHHSLFGSPELNKTNLLVFGMSAGDVVNNHTEVYTRNIVTPRFQASPKSAHGTFEDAFKIVTPETFIFKEDTKISDYPSLLEDIETLPEVLNNNVYFLPRPLDIDGHSRVLMDVFIENESGNDIEWDHALNQGELTTSSLGSASLDVSFIYTGATEEKYIKQGDGLKEVEKYGEIVIDEHTYYDYDSQSVKVGMSSTSQLGELIPYNYSGEYTRNLEIKVNDSIGVVNMQWGADISSPLLDEFEGLHRLHIDNDHPSTITELKHLPAEAVTALRERMKDDDEKYATLSWFNRQHDA